MEINEENKRKIKVFLLNDEDNTPIAYKLLNNGFKGDANFFEIDRINDKLMKKFRKFKQSKVVVFAYNKYTDKYLEFEHHANVLSYKALKVFLREIID